MSICPVISIVRNLKAEAVGCTENDARTSLYDQLLTQAEAILKKAGTPCKGECDPGRNVCTLLIELAGRVGVSIIRRKGCPHSVGFYCKYAGKVRIKCSCIPR